MRKKIILLSIFLVLTGAFIWTRSHSFIEISVDNANGTIVYNLSRQGSGKSLEIKTTSTRIKKLVPVGSYEAWAISAGNSSYSIVKTKGFLASLQKHLSLVPEKYRKFIGDNPNSCMNIVNGDLVSYSCGDYYGNLKIHLPATQDLPTYIENVQNTKASGKNEGIINFNGESFALIYGSSDEKMPAAHRLYKINNDLSLTDPIFLSDLNQKKLYTVKDLGNGFIVYDSNISQALYYSSPNSKPVKIDTNLVTTKDYRPFALDTRPNKFMVLYSNKTGDKDRSSSSEVVITDNNRPTRFAFSKKSYTNSFFCGDQKICLLGSGLDVYDTSSGQAQLYLSLDNASAVEATKSGLLIVNKTGVLNLDLVNKRGFYEYVFGEYKYNTLQPSGTGYILSLTNNKNRKVAILVDQTSNDVDSIDQKIIELQKMPEISFVSIYDKLIYVYADLGKPAYDSLTKSYINNPQIKQSVSSAINKELNALGIDRRTYTISSNAF